MKNNRKDKNQNLNENVDATGNSSRGYGYTSFCLAIAAVIFLPFMFLISVYALCGSALCALASLAFYNSQKTRGLFPLVKAARIIAYVALILCAVVLIGAIIYLAL